MPATAALLGEKHEDHCTKKVLTAKQKFMSSIDIYFELISKGKGVLFHIIIPVWIDGWMD